MKSLRAFWHWVDNEKPAELESEHFRHLSDLADLALDTAGDMVGERIGQPHAYVGRLRDHWPAVRDLSLAICEALEKMHEAVPKAEQSAYRFEGPVVLDEMATFRDVDSGRYEGTLADAKPAPLIPQCPACLYSPCRGQRWNCTYGDGLKLLRSADDQERAHAAMFRREYLAEWVPDPQHAIAASRRNAEMQLAAQSQRVHLGQSRSNYNSITRQIVVFTSVTVPELNAFRGLRPNSILVRGEPHDYQAGTREVMGNVLWPMHRDGAVVVTRDSAEPPSAFFQP